MFGVLILLGGDIDAKGESFIVTVTIIMRALLEEKEYRSHNHN